ncbi:MAG: bifunctional adenosylcobinamide kinase/adenosylcobinamide-phosphate guanylyltransferase [Oscillospiraceae bacterium]|nr:bifunctional adenosylcobinamide kinase/adenosylcobinamide-phosphate guanylyltransferase [Oscillospiraceae bacterium]
MGELILISGPNDSGKSRFAEALLARRALPRFYLATMRPVTAENYARIEKHRRQREGLGFTTLETPDRVGDAAITPGCAVLLEDVSNLLANAMFGGGGDGETVLADIAVLRSRCALMAAVTITGLDPADYEGETALYAAALGRLNAALLAEADAAAALENGAPRWLKGEAK